MQWSNFYVALSHRITRYHFILWVTLYFKAFHNLKILRERRSSTLSSTLNTPRGFFGVMWCLKPLLPSRDNQDKYIPLAEVYIRTIATTSQRIESRGKALKTHVHFVEKIKKSIKKIKKNQLKSQEKIQNKKISYAFFSSRRRHTRCSGVSWARRCV